MSAARHSVTRRLAASLAVLVMLVAGRAQATVGAWTVGDWTNGFTAAENNIARGMVIRSATHLTDGVATPNSCPEPRLGGNTDVVFNVVGQFSP